jgi:protein O-GlcNAc transferase
MVAMTQKDDDINDEFYALYLRGEGRLDDAIEIYRKQLALHPLHARTRSQLAVTLVQKGDITAGLHEARIAVEAEPDNYALRMILVVLLLKNGTWVDALTESKELLRMSPGTSTSHELAGDAHRGLGDLPAAVACYEAAIGLDTYDADTFTTLGQLYEESGRIEDAITAYRRALHIAPKLRLGRLNLGKALAVSGRVVEARHEWKRLLEGSDFEGGGRSQTGLAPDESAVLASKYLEQYPEE